MIFLYHLLAIVIVFVYTFIMSWLGYTLIDSLIPMRVSAFSERWASTSRSMTSTTDWRISASESWRNTKNT